MRRLLLGLVGIAIIGCLLWLYLYRTSPVADEGSVVGEFGGVSLTLDFATTSESRAKGLSGRESLPEDYGMLFVFPEDAYHGFWMKDTLVPLDIFWLDATGKVVSWHEGVVPETYPLVFYPLVPARYVLETEAGFGALHDIATGTPLLLKSFPVVLD